jgi:CheY-like chemotaxis protein
VSVSATVLIVDDYPASRYALGRMVRRLGHRVVEVSCGQEMLAALEQQAFDLLILDVHLPDASGFDLCRDLKGDPAHADLPVIIVSATYASADHEEQTVAAGADVYLEHPIMDEQLAAHVRRLLASRPERAPEG